MKQRHFFTLALDTLPCHPMGNCMLSSHLWYMYFFLWVNLCWSDIFTQVIHLINVAPTIHWVYAKSHMNMYESTGIRDLLAHEYV